jgi:hypothetical protein
MPISPKHPIKDPFAVTKQFIKEAGFLSETWQWYQPQQTGTYRQPYKQFQVCCLMTLGKRIVLE